MKIFLSGYYGAKNFGDELLLFKIIEDITKIIPQAEFFVWSLDKNFTEELLKDFTVTAVDRFNLTDTVNAVKNSDIVVSGGGGIIQEYYGIKIEDLFKDFGKNIPSYALPPLLGKIFNKKVFYWCLGHGPVVTEEGLLFSRWFYSLADVVTLRDEHSYSSVKKLLPEAKVFLDTDPLLSFEFNRFSIEKKEKNILGVSIRNWFNEEELISKTAEALKKLIDYNNNLKILLIPCDFNLDIAVMKKIASFLPDKNLFDFSFESIWDIVKAISLCDWFSGMRLHCLICAYKLEKPILGLSYDAKTEEFLKSVGADYLKATELTSEELFLKLKKLLKSDSLKQKKFEYKTPEIFKSFVNNSELSLNCPDLFFEEQSYVKDFVKTLMLQREDFYRQLSKLKSENEYFKQQNKDLEQQNKDLEQQNKDLKSERDNYILRLNEICHSNAWRFVQSYYKIRDNTPLKYLYPYYKPLVNKLFKRKKKSFENTKEKESYKKVRHFLEGYEKIFIMLSSIPFNLLYNQRPLNLSKEFSRLNYGVLFVSWQWSADEVIPSSYEEVYKGVFQIPMYDFFEFYKTISYPYTEKILYVSFPVEIFISLIRELRKNGFKIVYDIMDDWEGFKDVGQAPWYEKEVEERIILEADFLFAVKKALSEKFSHIRKDIIISKNAHNEEVLGLDAKFTAGSMTDDTSFTVGYYGWLNEGRFDWDFIFELARAFKEIRIQLIGYALSEKIQGKLTSHRNIEYLGTVNPKELKNFVARWNTGIIPFKEKEISKGADPLKLYEYIYFGLPTIVRGVSDLKERPLVFCVNSVDDFGKIIEMFNSRQKIKQFQNENKGLVEEFLKNNNWKARVSEIIGIINRETFW